MSFPVDMLSTENISSDIFHGCFVISCTLFTFLGLVWLREQILHAGGPDWLERDNVQLPPVDNPVHGEQVQDQDAVQPEAENNNDLMEFEVLPQQRRAQEPNVVQPEGNNHGKFQCHFLLSNSFKYRLIL